MLDDSDNWNTSVLNKTTLKGKLTMEEKQQVADYIKLLSTVSVNSAINLFP